MPTYVVTGPDGKRYRVTAPEGATEADVMARVSGQAKPTSFWQGVAEGLQKPATNAVRMLAKTNPLGMLADAATGVVRNTAVGMDRGAEAAKARSPYQGSTAGRITGGIVGSLPTALLPGGAVAQGAYGGAAMTNDINDVRGTAIDAAIGATAGKLGQQVGKRVLAPVAERIGRTAPVRRLGEAAAKAVGKAPLPLPKVTKAERVVARATPDLAPVRQNVADAARLKLPYALADADPRLRTLGGSVARFSPDARTMAEKNFGARAEDQGFRAIQGIRDYLHPTTDIKRVAQDIRGVAQSKAGPFYDKAFEGGSMAPLESQLDDAFGQSSKAVAEAQAELAAAQRGQTLSRAAVNRAGNNVYANASALPADRQAQSVITAAEQRLAEAQGSHSQVLEMLRRAQNDASANAPGATWSPRIQQFLDDPISKQGLGRGMEIQRLEALANGRQFNPTELAITGVDEAGNPIVSGVPNMRTLDAVKKGLDAIIDDYPKDFRGKPILDERGRAVTQVLKSFRKEVDTINPDYAAARGVYEQYIRPATALQQGFNSTGKNVPARDLAKIVEGYNPKELAQARAGYATSLADQVANAADSADPYKMISGGINRRDKLGIMFPEGSQSFARLHDLEKEMARTATETFGGSQTQPRAIADSMFQNDMANSAADAGIQMMTGGGVPGATKILGELARAAKDRSQLGLLGAKNKADALAPQLFDTSNPQGILDFLDGMARKAREEELRKQAYQRTFGLLGVPSAAVGVGSTR